MGYLCQLQWRTISSYPGPLSMIRKAQWSRKQCSREVCRNLVSWRRGSLRGLPPSGCESVQTCVFSSAQFGAGLGLTLSWIPSDYLPFSRQQVQGSCICQAMRNKTWAMFMCALACEQKKDRFDKELKLKNSTTEGEFFSGFQPIPATPTVCHFALSLSAMNCLEDDFRRIFISWTARVFWALF